MAGTKTHTWMLESAMRDTVFHEPSCTPPAFLDVDLLCNWFRALWLKQALGKHKWWLSRQVTPQ